MKLQQLKGAAEVMTAKAEPSQNDQSLWSMIATAKQVEDLVRQIQELHTELGLQFDALQFMGVSTAQAEPQQVLDLINEIESLQTQVEQKQAA
ncbi:hypothetical protein [Pontibacterium sp.]|uniref:hypothetical protein n=1 Tax=Pontibacterium sp. TaxID=2036026 RepID=UPI003564D370